MNIRLKNIFRLFDKNAIDAFFVSSWPNVTYLSGFKGSESWLYVSPKGLYFITDSRYAEQAKNEAKGFKIILRDKKSVSEIVAHLTQITKAKRVGFESAQVTFSFYKSLEKAVGVDKLKPTHNLVESLRIIKDENEIALLQRTADIAVKGLHYTRQTVRPGMTEREVQGRLEFYTKSIGSEKPAFDIIIAAGARASMPHCQSDETPIKNNDSVLVDMGTVFGGYYSDLTRPIFLGKMSPLHQKINSIVWEAQRAGIRKAGPGVPASAVDEACRAYIRKTRLRRLFWARTGPWRRA